MKKNDVTGFDFQVIPLEEAQRLTIGGGGNYAELKIHLLEQIGNIAPDQAFAFGLPKGKEVPEDQRRGICMALNNALRKSGFSWRTTYSGTRKLFVVMPKEVIKKRLEMPTLYRVVDKDKPVSELEGLVQKAAKLFRIDREVLLSRKRRIPGIQKIRKAIYAIALKELLYTNKAIGNYFGVTGDAIYQTLHNDTVASEEFALLKKSIKGGLNGSKVHESSDRNKGPA